MIVRAQKDVATLIRRARRDLDAIVRDTTGADSEPVRQAASVLVRAWRRILGVQGSALARSAAGQAPRQQLLRLRRSVKTAVVDGVRRVGSGDFRARLFEFGGYKDRSGEPQPARPHAQPAAESVADQMGEVLVSAAQQRVASGR